MCGSGQRTERIACNTIGCPYLSLWSDWGQCSATCGHGTRTRNRECIGPDNNYAKCYAALTEDELCMTAECSKFNYVI